MVDDPRKAEADAPADEAPEARNREQDDEEAQAQSVAEAARRDRPQQDSDKVSRGDDSDDVQDLVDHMKQMERSGVIDMDAYRGERSDDDEDGELGPGGVEDDEPRGAP
ncbi:MAG: hypothetical protein H2055_07405 [Sphingopyxis sp.]|nr:hypothetical protein [Sphingopyxis sp.]